MKKLFAAMALALLASTASAKQETQDVTQFVLNSEQLAQLAVSQPNSWFTVSFAKGPNDNANCHAFKNCPQEPAGQPVPEPGTVAMVGLGFLVMLLVARRNLRQVS